MRWGRGVRAGVAFGALLLGQAGHATEVRELRATPTPTGATLRLVASGPLHVAVRRVAPLDERERLYVDLPPGTRVASGLLGGLTAAPPIAGMRLGLAEGGRLCLVLELDGTVGYRLGAPGRVVELTFTRAPTPEATFRGAEDRDRPRPWRAGPRGTRLRGGEGRHAGHLDTSRPSAARTARRTR